MKTFKSVYILIIFLTASADVLHAQGFKSNSVLSTGDFYKIQVSENGIYKIDHDFLKAIGLNPARININTIGVFGAKTGMLNQSNNSNNTLVSLSNKNRL